MENTNSKVNVIDIHKGSSSCEILTENTWDIMSNSMRELIEIFFLTKEDFLKKKPLDKLKDYIEKYDRLLYTVLSDRIYERFSDIEKKEELILRNIDLLLELCARDIDDCPHSGNNSELRKREETRKIALKLKDHANLAIRQYRSLKQTDEEYVKKFNRQIGSFKENVMKEITSQLITLVGIFTAIAFILFGGISSFNNIFSVIKETSTLKLIIVSCLWIVGMSDIVFIFLLGISKMTNLDIGDKINTNILEKYIWIFWFNAIFISIFVCSLWLIFGISIGVFSYFTTLKTLKYIIFYAGVVGVLYANYFIFSFLMKKTKNNNC